VVQEDRAEPGDAEGPAELLERVQQPCRRAGLVRLNAMERFREEGGREQSDSGTADRESGQ